MDEWLPVLVFEKIGLLVALAGGFLAVALAGALPVDLALVAPGHSQPTQIKYYVLLLTIRYAYMRQSYRPLPAVLEKCRTAIPQPPHELPSQLPQGKTSRFFLLLLIP